MLPDELREKLFERNDVQSLPTPIVFATVYAVERVIEESDYELVKKERVEDGIL